MLGRRWMMSGPCRHPRVLICTAVVLVCLNTLFSLNMSRWELLTFGQCLSNSGHKMLAFICQSESNTSHLSKQQVVTPSESQLTAAASELSFGATIRNQFVRGPMVSMTTTIASMPTYPQLRNPVMYVRSANLGTGQLGNTMFEYISSYVIALRLGLKFIVSADGRFLQAYKRMSSLFKISAPLYSGHFPVGHSVDEQGWGIYTPAVTKLESYGNFTEIYGWLQSWRYFAGFEHFVHKEFSLTDRYRSFVDSFFAKHNIRLISKGRKRATLIAIHVRRGDMLAHLDQYQMATPKYLVHAIGYFRKLYADQHLTFVVATDDKPWTRAIVDGALQNGSVSVIYANGTAEEDMAVLSSCHHAIITGGTYGWWAAWLTGGNVMFFKDFVWNGSTEWRNYKAEDYYPSSWIGST